MCGSILHFNKNTMINREKFKENFRYYDNEVVVEIMDIFLHEYADNLEVLQQSVDQLDFDAINHKAHAMKGVVSYMSPELSELCFKLEKMGKDKNSHDLQLAFRLLKEGILEIVPELKTIRQEYAA